jgi:hypothetical protein
MIHFKKSGVLNTEDSQAKTYKSQGKLNIYNDPSAGSPTETLLRLLLPLNDQV